MSEQQKDDSEIGALWMETGTRGDYMTGTINGVKVVVFKNDKKAPGSKQPDWRVLKSKPKAAKPDTGHDLNAPATITDDSIPF